jgi:hypothetical protein
MTFISTEKCHLSGRYYKIVFVRTSGGSAKEFGPENNSEA